MERCTISVLMLMQYNSVEDVQGLKLQGILSQLKKRGVQQWKQYWVCCTDIFITSKLVQSHWITEQVNPRIRQKYLSKIRKEKDIHRVPHILIVQYHKNIGFVLKVVSVSLCDGGQRLGRPLGVWKVGRSGIVALGAPWRQERPFQSQMDFDTSQQEENS